MTEQAESLKAELEAEWGINPGSSNQLREYFKLDAREDWPKTAGGAPKTDQDAMKALKEEEPFVAKWVEWKRVEKLRSTYGKSLQKHSSTAESTRGSTRSARGYGTLQLEHAEPTEHPKARGAWITSPRALLGRNRGPRANQGGLHQYRALGGGDPVG
jgi:DNA polymerase family A